MLKAYLNYPSKGFGVHLDPKCKHIQKHGKSNQRYVRINPKTISIELQNFAAHGYPFGATSQTNDMWLEVEFGDPAFELAVLSHVHRLLGREHEPFAQALMEFDCP